MSVGVPDERGVVLVRLCSGQPANRMTPALHEELAALWPRLAGTAGVRSAVLLGAPDGFGLGTDLAYARHIAEGPPEVRVRLLEEARAIVVGALDCDLPIVAGVRGGAAGAALAVALLADVCVVAHDAVLADGHARIGVPAGDHAVLLWPLLCGMSRSKRHLLLAERLTGRQAAEIGLVSDTVPDDEVEGVARMLAGRLADQPRDAVRWTKRALHHWYRAMLPAFESSLAHELLGFGTPAAAEGVRALAERRPADFRGTEVTGG